MGDSKADKVTDIFQSIKEDVVPVIIVLVLLGTYAILLITGRPITDDLKSLVTVVVTFYFAKSAVNAAASNVRSTAAAIMDHNNGKI